MQMIVLYVLITLMFSFLCSISEAVLLRVTAPYVAALEQKNKYAGKILRKLKDDMNRPLAAILTLNTVANTIGATGVGAQAAIIFGSIHVGAVSVILTLLILVFAEIIPKTLGMVYWRQLAPVLAPVIRDMVYILYPFVWLSVRLTRGFSQGPSLKGLSREEFAAMADLGAKEGQLEAKESRIMKNLFLFRSSTITDIMTPRTVVFALQEKTTIAEFLERHQQASFSRIPIFDKNLDDITGFVLKDDILLAQAREMDNSLLQEFKRDIKVVPDNWTLSELFEFFLDRREHIVLVVDEYGGMEGIVTLEDVVETLLGLEIVDEGDKNVDMQALARALWKKRAQKIGLISDDKPSALELIEQDSQIEGEPKDAGSQELTHESDGV